MSSDNSQTISQPQPQKSLGQIAYDEYNKTVPRDDSWENQGAYLRRRWEVAAKAVADQTYTGEYWNCVNDEVNRMRERINELEKERDALQNDLTTQWSRLRAIAAIVDHKMGDDSVDLPGSVNSRIVQLQSQIDHYLTPAQPLVSADKPLGQVACETYFPNDRWEDRPRSNQDSWNEVAQAVLEAWGPPQATSEPQSRNAFGYGFVLEHPVDLPPMQRKIVQQCMALMTTLVRKNTDYGDSAFKSPSLMPSLSAVDAVAVRMSDKIARIANLSSSQRSSGPAVSDESLIDSYLDLAGYAVLQVINLQLLPKPPVEWAGKVTKNPDGSTDIERDNVDIINSHKAFRKKYNCE